MAGERVRWPIVVDRARAIVEGYEGGVTLRQACPRPRADPPWRADGRAAGRLHHHPPRRPKAPEPPEEGQDLPAEVMRQLCAHLDLFEDMTCPELRLTVELLIDTGRRPEEICRLELNCLTRDGQGKPVLTYDNWKEQRQRRQLPIHEPTAKLILDQQERVRARFPKEPASKLVLLPTQNLNLHGDRAIDSNHLSGMHRQWVEALPEFRLDAGTVFDKEKIFPHAYRHSYAQRHADADVPIDALA